MSFMQAIFGGKGSVPPTAPNQPQNITNNPANNPQPASTQQTAQTAPNGVVPADPAHTQGPATQSPGDKFKDLWEPPKTEKQEPPADSGLTSEKMLEAAGKVDFTKVLDQESLKKIATGGEDAMQALAQLLNKTAQTVYGQALVVSNKIIDQRLADAESKFAERVPGMVKSSAMRESLLRDNPTFKDPAVAPVVAAIQAQLATKYPNASSDELNQMAKEYFKDASGKLNPQEPPKATAEDNFDWEAWASKDLKLG
jgi:hypothetical protein